MKKVDELPTKEIGLWMVICWIFAVLAGIISIFSCVVTIQAGQILVGVLFLFLGVFIFIPKKFIRITPALRGAIFIVVYFVLLIISGLDAPVPEQQYEYYNLGQPFNLTFGKNILQVVMINTTETTTLILDGQERTSSGIYLFVNGEITNNQKTPLDVGFSSELKDNQDNLYTLFARNIVGGQLQPNLKRDFSHIFEIPKQTSGLKLFIKDKTKIIKVVNLE